jgi:ABC-type antimicrobial peptide transport system permease subunit
MLRNYFLIAIRNIIKSPLISAIKIAGLAVGIAGCLVIFLMANFEFSFDKFQPDRERIYRVYSQFSGVFEGFNRGVCIPVGSAIKEEFSGVEAVAAFQTYTAKVFTEEKGATKKFDKQEDIAIVPSDYFRVFSFYRWKAGTASALDEPFQVVLTEAKASKYFGTSNPDQVLGQKLIYNDSLNLTVGGIVADIEDNTDLYFTDFVSYPTIEKSWLKEDFKPDDWGSTNSSSQCFIKLLKGTELKKVDDQMPLLASKYKEKNPDADWRADYHLQALPDLHFNTDLGLFDNGRSDAADLGTLKTLMIVAVLMLLIAVINFVNLETAQAVRRAKEVGLRKVMGGTRGSLIQFFLLESSVLSTVAVLLALPMAGLALQLFSEFLPEGIQLQLADPLTLTFLFSTIALVSVLSGIYPAFVLSGYQPAQALKNQVFNSRLSRSAQLRKLLTIFQFSVSQVLIVGTLLVGWQIKFMLDKELGFRKDAIITFGTPWWERKEKAATLKTELERIPQVEVISRHQAPVAVRGYSTNSFTFEEGGVKTPINVHQRKGDTSYLRLYELRLLVGRNVQPSESAKEMVVNEAFCRQLGFDDPREMVGKQIKSGNDEVYTIVGVLADFHFRSLHHAIEPLYFAYDADPSGFSVKLATGGDGKVQGMESTLEEIKKVIRKAYPDYEFTISFVDETIGKFYERETKTSKLVNTATALTIFISCLGLLGLASFTATQRTKEIGIRKVLGATVNNIVGLLSLQFLKWVAIAFVLAVPIAWYAGDWWLKDYAYRLPLSGWLFATAGIISLLIAFLTVGFQALKAAMTNPVESLRYE